MSVLESVLKEELERLERNIAAYEEILSPLQKGYIYVQSIRGHSYCYRKWREGKKIKSAYIGEFGSAKAEQAKKDYSERKRIEANLGTLKKEKIKLEKALSHYKK